MIDPSQEIQNTIFEQFDTLSEIIVIFISVSGPLSGRYL